MKLQNKDNTMRSLFAALTVTAFTIVHPALADGHQSGLTGATVVITNTFQGEQTDGVETDVAAFRLTNNQFAIVGDGVEFADFITLYTVDISGNSIAYTWGDGDFAQQLSGPTPDGNHDRNYFVFDLPEGQVITSVTLDEAASALLEGSAAPTAMVLAPNRIVTDFSSGVIRGVGFNPVFSVSVEAAN